MGGVMKIEDFKKEFVSELVKTGYYCDQSAKIIVSELDSDFIKDYAIDEDFRGAIKCIEDCFTEIEDEPQDDFFDFWALSNGSFLVNHTELFQ